jgi:L-lactate dehydrogenase complex protein LldE
VAVLERLGMRVQFPLEQTCCGQMHFNTGYARETVPLVRRFVRAFAGCEAIVSPSASCVGMVREQYPRVAELSGDPGLAREVAALLPRVLDFTELLVDRLGVEDVGAYFPHRVTYHPTCHGLRMLGLGDRPLRLLRAVRGIDVVELPEAKECCGFGGTFAVKLGEVSARIADNKCQHIVTSGADAVVLGDLGCMLTIEGRLRRRGDATSVLHVAEVLSGVMPDRT